MGRITNIARAALAVLLAAAWCLPAPAGTAPAGKSTNSSVRDGSKLKWLPHRPSPQYVASRQVVATQWLAQQGEKLAVEPAVPGDADALQDPFGDRGAAPGLDRGRPKLEPAPLDFPDEQPQPPEKPSEKTPSPKTYEELDLPPLERDLTRADDALPEYGKCPSADDLKPINKITYDITAPKGEFPKECPWGDKTFQPRCWEPITYTWTASSLCHHPLYFEDVQLERYGHSWGPYLQPVISAGHFFLTVPILPYLMGINPPCECQYSLGYYRPGSCAPYMLDPIPLSLRGALFEGGAWTGMVFLIP